MMLAACFSCAHPFAAGIGRALVGEPLEGVGLSCWPYIAESRVSKVPEHLNVRRLFLAHLLKQAELAFLPGDMPRLHGLESLVLKHSVNLGRAHSWFARNAVAKHG